MSRDRPQVSRETSPGEEPDYSYAHRAFLQAFLTQPVMTVDEIKPIFAAVMTAYNPSRPMQEGDVTLPLLISTIQAINARLTTLDYEIRSTRDQITKTLTYALINTTSDPFTQLATTFSADEIAYIKRLLDCMFETNNQSSREIMAVKSMQAAQLAKAPRRERQSQIGGEGGEGETQIQTQARLENVREPEVFLAKLVNQGWLLKVKSGGDDWYTLAPRALMELRSYLKETYNEAPAEEEEEEDDDDDDDDDDNDEGIIRVHDCEGCREIVTFGYRCSDRTCRVRWHDACAKQYFQNQGANARRCPICKADWTAELHVGPKANQIQRRSEVRKGRSSGLVEQEQEVYNEDE